jgi:hypothetical protein
VRSLLDYLAVVRRVLDAGERPRALVSAPAGGAARDHART